MSEEVKTYILEFLKSFTRLLVQSNLYNEQHPQVKEAAAEAYKNIALIFKSTNTGEISLTIEQNKLMINGIPFIQTEKLPNTFLNLFKKTNCDTLTFKSSVTEREIIIFSRILSSKNSPDLFLKENSISNIKLEKSIYEKAGKNINKNEETKSTLLSLDKIKNKTFEESLKEIASKLTSDENEQNQIINALFSKFKQEVEDKVNKAISEIKKEKIKVENDYQRTEAVISNIANGVLTVDKDGNIIMANPEAQIITGKPLKEIAGKKIFDVTNIENQVLNIAKGLKTESDKPISPQIETKAKEDLSKTIKNSTAIIKNEEGKIVGTISLPTDIAKLREIDQLKNDFISTMTHELRSPLTSIKMALDLVSRENLSPDISNMINAAIRNSERLNSIISDILDFSKLQSGKMTFNLIDNDPIEIANEAIDSMKAWSKSKNIDLTLDKSATLPKIYCDKKRTEQILINLISNSLKFTATNGKITVSVYQKENDSNFVFFSVKDNGCGIKKEDLSKIFEKFVQALSGEKLGGTGLGLAITKAMVVMQGGNIYVESEYGKGSNFIFTIPVYRKSNESFKPKEEKTKSWWQKLFRI